MTWSQRFWIAAPSVLLGMTVGSGLVVRDCALTCNVGFRLAPLAYLAIAVLAVPFVALQLRFLPRVDPATWPARCAFFAALVFVGFRNWTYQVVADNPWSGPTSAPVPAIQAAYLAYFVFVDPLFVLLFTNLVRLVQRIAGEQASSGLTLFAASALAGGMLGSGFARAFVPWLMSQDVRYETARDHLMLVMAACVAVHGALAGLAARRFPSSLTAAAGLGTGLRAGLRVIVGDARLRWTGALLVLTGVACIVLDYVFFWQISDDVDASHGRTSFFAELYFWINATSFVLLLFGTGKLLDKLGLAPSLFLLPVALLLGSAGLLVAPSLLLFCAIRIAKDGIVRTLFEPATERVMLRDGGDRYDLVRTVLAGLGFSLGMGVGAVLLLALTVGLGAERRTVVECLVGVIAVWIGAIELQRRAARTSTE